MEIKTELKTTQKLALTPQMRQSIEILQMNCVELKNRIDQEMLENPVLEFNDTALTSEDAGPAEEPKKKENDEAIDWQDYFEKIQNGDYSVHNGQVAEEKPDPFNQYKTGEMSLKEYLSLQLHSAPQIDQTLGEGVIDAIDDDGYLYLDEAAFAREHGVSDAVLQETITAVQAFDPPGVGARNIGECLIIQIDQLGLLTVANQRLIEEHLLDIANNQFGKVAKATGEKEQDIRDLKMLMKEMNPRPGSAFSKEAPVEYVLPDGSIEWIDGKLVVHINDISAPRLRISRFYERMLKSDDPKARAYLEERLDRARFLIQAITMRRETIRRIVTAIAEYQEDYFCFHNQYPKALTMHQVARMAEVHESTVSRAIRGKYIRTPQGIFELKCFFKRGYGEGKTDISADGIKAIIKQMIEGEDPKKPVSDQVIADRLKQEGFDVARRTVAKYREAMGILATSKRRDR